MSAQVVNTLITEMDANTIHLEQKLAEAQRKIEQLEQRTVSANKVTVQTSTQAAGAVGNLAQRYGVAAQAAAGAGAMVAQQGKVTVETAKTMIAQASNMAFMFGVAGPIVGAIGITTLAVVELFGRARREMEETARQFDEKLAGMRKSGNLVGAADLQRELFSGDTFAEQGKDESDAVFRLRRLGVQGAKRRLAEIDALLTQWAKEDMNAVGPVIREARQLALNKLYEEQRQLTQALPEYESRHKKATAAVEELTAAEGKRLLNVQAIEKAEKARDQAAKLTKEQARELKQFSEQMGDLQGKLSLEDFLEPLRKHAADLQKQMQDLAVAMTPTAVDDMRLALARLREELAKKGAPQQFIDQVTAWQEGLIAAKDLHEKVTEALQKARQGTEQGLDRNAERNILNQQEDALRFLAAATDNVELRKQAEALINDILERRKALMKDDADAAKETEWSAREIASAVAASASAALALADAFGVVDQRTMSILRNLQGMAEGVEKILSGDVAQGGVQLAANAIAMAVNIGKDPEHAEKVRVQRENTEAIVRLTAGLVSLSGIGGTTVTRAAPFVDAIVRATANASHREKVYGIDNLGPNAFPAIKAAADALGITLDGTVESFRLLQQAITAARAQMAEFGTSFEEQQAQWDAFQRIFGPQDAQNQLGWLANTAGNMAPALQQLFMGLNLSSGGGQDELRKRVQDLFTTMMAGDAKLDASALGGLSREQFVDILASIISTLDALAPAAKAAGEALAEALSSIDQELEIMDVTDPGERFARRAAAYRAIGGSLGELFAGLDLTNPADVAKLDERVRALFEQLKTSPESVNLAGLSVGELIQALLALDAAADDVAAGVISAAQAFSDAVASLDTDLEVAGEKDPLKRALGVAGAAGSSFAGIGAALAGIDLSTADGRAKAIAALQALYGSDKGNADQTQAILEVLRALRAIPGEAPLEEGRGGARAAGDREAITNSAKALTEATGNRMADYLRSIDIRVQTIVDLMARLAGLASGPVLTPAIALGGPFSGGFDAAPRITIQTTVYVSADDVRDGREWGRELGDGIFDRFNEQMGRKFRRAQIINGNTDRPGVS